MENHLEMMMKRLAAATALSVLVSGALAQSADGEVRKIDKAQAKITLRHGEIKSLEMPPMTMVFRVQDARLLEGLAVGDKVRFDAQKIDGQYTVTVLVKAP